MEDLLLGVHVVAKTLNLEISCYAARVLIYPIRSLFYGIVAAVTVVLALTL